MFIGLGVGPKSTRCRHPTRWYINDRSPKSNGRSLAHGRLRPLGHSRRSVVGVGEAPTRAHRLSVLTLLALGRKDSATAQQVHRFLIKTIASRFAAAYKALHAAY